MGLLPNVRETRFSVNSSPERSKLLKIRLSGQFQDHLRIAGNSGSTLKSPYQSGTKVSLYDTNLALIQQSS